jgi:hypothetical protein
MRPEAAPPDQAALDLLTHADALALAATEAIAAGDDAALAMLLEERGIVVEAAIDALRQVMAAPPRPELAARLAAAARGSIATGADARVVAERAREQLSAEMAVLDARTLAAQEYRQDAQAATINVVL